MRICSLFAAIATLLLSGCDDKSLKEYDLKTQSGSYHELVLQLELQIKFQKSLIETLTELARLHEKNASQIKEDLDATRHFYTCAMMELLSHPIFQAENPPLPEGWSVGDGMILIENPERYK